MNFLLLQISPGYEFYPRTKKPQKILSYHPPLGLLYLGRVLEDAGHTVKIIDFLAEKYPVETLKQSLTTADAVGMSIYSSAYKE